VTETDGDSVLLDPESQFTWLDKITGIRFQLDWGGNRKIYFLAPGVRFGVHRQKVVDSIRRGRIQ
jgi:hypothetical protein